MANKVLLNIAKDYIYSFDLSSIIEKLVYLEGWLKTDALETSEYYRNFLFLLKKYGSLSPSLDIDEFWHHHILNTQKYTKDCQHIYGEYKHHFPHNIRNNFGEYEFNQSKMLSYENTQKLHFEEFGKYIYATKSRYPKIFYSLMKKIHL